MKANAVEREAVGALKDQPRNLCTLRASLDAVARLNWTSEVHRGSLSEPSVAKAQLTDHGIRLELLSSCSSRTASREADVPVTCMPALYLV